MNHAKQNSEEVIKSLRNVTSIKTETVPDKENSLNYLKEKSRKRKRNNTNHNKRQCWTKMLKEYPAEEKYICIQDQNQAFKNTLQFQKKIEEIKELKEKYENAKER